MMTGEEHFHEAMRDVLRIIRRPVVQLLESQTRSETPEARHERLPDEARAAFEAEVRELMRSLRAIVLEGEYARGIELVNDCLVRLNDINRAAFAREVTSLELDSVNQSFAALLNNFEFMKAHLSS
jgi:negative regulator of replication initiation